MQCMPGYADHKRVTAITSVLVAGGMFVGYQVVYRGLEYFEAIPAGSVEEHLPNTLLVMGLVSLGVLFGGTLGSPDLDIPSTPYNHWGVFRYVWLPYQIMIKHRSPFSHWPVLATVFKLVYLYLMLNIIANVLILMANGWFYAVGQTLRIGISIGDVAVFFFQPLRYPIVWIFLVGDVIGEASHIITDYLDGRRRVRYFDDAVPPLAEGETEDTPYDRRHRYGG